MELANCASPVLVCASHPFYLREIVRRLCGQITLWPVGDWHLDGYDLQRTLDLCQDPGRSIALHHPDSKPLPVYSAIILAMPETVDWNKILAGHLPMAEGSRLVVIGRTARLERFTPDLAQGPSQPVSLVAAQQTLVSAGWRVEKTYGFHGPLSLALGVASRLPAILGRDDLVDRLLAAMRAHYVVRGWQARCSPLWLLVGTAKGTR